MELLSSLLRWKKRAEVVQTYMSGGIRCVRTPCTLQEVVFWGVLCAPLWVDDVAQMYGQHVQYDILQQRHCDQSF